VAYQYPEDVMTNEVFDSISDYVIIKPILSGRSITVSTTTGLKVVGNPVCLSDQKYLRNAFMFNLVFVFSESAAVRSFYTLVIKLSQFLSEIETDLEFLSNPNTKPQIMKIITDLYVSLRQYKTCSIRIDDMYFMDVFIPTDIPASQDVQPFDVPLPIRDDLESVVSKDWDLTLHKILPFIDGINYVSRIAALSGVDLELVKSCIQSLIEYHCVSIIDIFQYSSSYAVTHRIRELYHNKDLRNECLEYISVVGGPTPRFSTVFSLYCGLYPGLTLAEYFNVRACDMEGIDDRCFIAYGVFSGILRRVHEYVLRNHVMQHSLSSQGIADLPSSEMRQLLAENGCLDSICVELNQKKSTVEALIKTLDKDSVKILK